MVCFLKCVFLLGYEHAENRYIFGSPTVTPLLHTKTHLDRKALIVTSKCMHRKVLLTYGSEQEKMDENKARDQELWL